MKRSIPSTSHNLGDEVELRIEDVSSEGLGVASLAGMAVFLPDTGVEDLVRARLIHLHSRYAEAEVLEVLEAGPHRIVPICEHFGRCGSCKWLHLDYAEQLRIKVNFIRQQLRRLGGIPDPPLLEAIPALNPHDYRNKMEFTFAETPQGEPALGMHIRGSFRHVYALKRCHIAPEWMSLACGIAMEAARSAGIPVYDDATAKGMLRFLVTREAVSTRERMIVLVIAKDDPAAVRPICEALTGKLNLTTTIVAINDRPSKTSQSRIYHTIQGPGGIREELGGLDFNIRADTFFQTNTPMAERLLTEVRAAVGRTDWAQLLDLYCGMGSLTLNLADHARSLVGIEMVPTAIEEAISLAEKKGIDSARFICGDVARVLRELHDKGFQSDLIVTDPPRSGMNPKVIRRLLRLGPQRLVYVSCNPATLARDVSDLALGGLVMRSCRPIDLFPQTPHCETVSIFERITE